MQKTMVENSPDPGYVALLKSGELRRRVTQAYERLTSCDLCPRECGADRRVGELGVCRTGERAVVSSYTAHFGEEGPLVGTHGSGTIFFAWCNLSCQYCQNFDISQQGHGELVEPEGLAQMMLALQARGCHNINFVSPSHVVAQLLAGVVIAAQAGLRIPLVYNTGGYDSVSALKLLDGVVDIYMPDMKYATDEDGRMYSKVGDYPAVNQAAVKEMHRQVGDLALNPKGTAVKGLLVRHLVLPNDIAGTAAIAQFLAGEISRDTYINVMDQYRPCYRAREYSQIDRPVTSAEFAAAVAEVRAAGLVRLDQRHPRILSVFR